jgi:hypothetical protein
MTGVCHWDDIYHGTGKDFIPTRATVIKAGEGVDFTDPLYEYFVDKVQSRGHNAFAYFALHTGTDAQILTQVKLAFKIVGTKIPLMWDWEAWQAESGSAAGIASLSMAELATKEYRDMGGVNHVAYFPHSMWARIGSPDLTGMTALGVRIQNADYRKGSDLAGADSFKAYGKQTPFANQFTDKPHDQNIAHMTWAAAKSIWHTGK